MVLLIVLLITFIKYDSNFKTEYTLVNHYKIKEIISKNLNQCNTDNIDLNKKFIVDKSLICKLEINNDNFTYASLAKMWSNLPMYEKTKEFPLHLKTRKTCFSYMGKNRKNQFCPQTQKTTYTRCAAYH